MSFGSRQGWPPRDPENADAIHPAVQLDSFVNDAG
jgi:hypothetical protein